MAPGTYLYIPQSIATWQKIFVSSAEDPRLVRNSMVGHKSATAVSQSPIVERLCIVR